MQLTKRLRPLVAKVLLTAVIVAAPASASHASRANGCTTPIRLELEVPTPDAKVLGRLKGRHEDFAGLLRELSRESSTCGAGRPLEVLVSDRQPLAVLNDMRGLLSKAGLADGRYYIVSSRGGKMVEIVFGKVVPYPDEQ